MTERMKGADISAAVDDLGWRYILGTLRTAVPVESLASAADAATRVAAAAGDDAAGHLWLDVRPDRLIATVQTRAIGWVTATDVALARRIGAALAEAGLRAEPTAASSARSGQLLEIAIDALDIPRIRPFWKAVLGYADEPGATDPAAAVVDPYEQQPAIWFQQMDEPRPQRNRIHFDISVPHDEAPARITAALDAGGTMVSDGDAPRFWVLADPEGNEICICTWQGRY